MYLGLGPSAHSFYDNKRLWNVSNNTTYVKSLAQNLLPLQEEVLSLEDRYNEYVMTSLRTKWGCSIAEIENNFSSELADYFRNEIELYVSSKNVLVKKEVYYLSEKGTLLADRIASDLFKVS
jgi:oxygen-independent coproporphyrinogen-3 oxidase